MAIKINKMFADTLLDLLEKKKLEKITITDLTSATGASRQTFYNHFKDKNDLIQWIYSNYILTNFQHPTATDNHLNYSAYLIDYYNRILKYKKFMSQAIRLNCQNDLKSFMEAYMVIWEREWFKSLYIEKYGSNPPENFYFIIEYHSTGCVRMICKWIESNYTLKPEEIANHIINLRTSILKYWDIEEVAYNFYNMDIDELGILNE
jgi:Transcriptional regulator